MSLDKLSNVTLKLIMVGDSSCGKTALLHHFIEGKFSEGGHTQTIGVEFGAKTLRIGDRAIKMQIWDTSGQERFRSVTHSYYRGALGALVVYDVTNRSSFDNLRSWLTDVRALAGPHVTVVLCGNKIDLAESGRQVSLLEGSRFAQENDCMFLETSALAGINVDEIFQKCGKTIVNKIDMGGIELVPGAAGKLRPKLIKGDSSATITSKAGSKSLCCNS
jgi:Ras-related protein Rab-4B